MEPNYELWEMAARLELNDVEEYCRQSALEQFQKVLEEGDGMEYFSGIGIRVGLRDIMMSELCAKAVQKKRNWKDFPMRAEDAVLQQIAAAQM